MSASLAQPMALDDFLAWERRQELRYEFDGTQPVAMTGGTIAHSVIATNIVRALDDRLSGPCRVFRGDLKIVAAGRVPYPDAVITYAAVADDTDIVPEPLVVFEVLSSSTALVDRNVKAAEYYATPSIRRYVLVEQTKAEVTVLERVESGWTQSVLTGLAAVPTLPEVSVELPLSDLYRRVQLTG